MSVLLLHYKNKYSIRKDEGSGDEIVRDLCVIHRIKIKYIEDFARALLHPLFTDARDDKMTMGIGVDESGSLL